MTFFFFRFFSGMEHCCVIPPRDFGSAAERPPLDDQVRRSSPDFVLL